jgi:hypothetical protein
MPRCVAWRFLLILPFWFREKSTFSIRFSEAFKVLDAMLLVEEDFQNRFKTLLQESGMPWMLWAGVLGNMADQVKDFAKNLGFVQKGKGVFAGVIPKSFPILGHWYIFRLFALD